MDRILASHPSSVREDWICLTIVMWARLSFTVTTQEMDQSFPPFYPILFYFILLILLLYSLSPTCQSQSILENWSNNLHRRQMIFRIAQIGCGSSPSYLTILAKVEKVWKKWSEGCIPLLIRDLNVDLESPRGMKEVRQSRIRWMPWTLHAWSVNVNNGCDVGSKAVGHGDSGC